MQRREAKRSHSHYCKDYGRDSFGAARREPPREVWGHAHPQVIFKIEHSETLSSVSGTQESVSQAGLEFTQVLFKK